jgi:hypothetical protein
MIENIQGHPRAFIASYAKDILNARIASGETSRDLVEAMHEWAEIADIIYSWTMKDQQEPMTDDQYIYIENLLEEKTNIDPKLLETIKANVKMYTVAEASKVIGMLLDPQLPMEYRDNLVQQRHIMQAVSQRAMRDE